MEQRLCEAAIEGSLESLNEIIGEDERILDKIVAGCFNCRPLHVAASRGHTIFVKELLHRNQKLAEVLDAERRSALHLASAEGHLEIVSELIVARPKMCLVLDRGGRNPLHIAAVEGKEEVLEQLLQASPNAAEVRVHREESILHLCVKHNQLGTLGLLLKNIGAQFINAKDIGGNTILHLAVLNGQNEIAVQLTKDTQIDLNATNANGQTALDIAYLALEGPSPKMEHVYIGDLLREANGKTSKDLTKFDWLKKKDTLMIVASIIATVTFQAIVNPPGGVWQDNSDTHRAGQAIMASSHPSFYSFFLWGNTIGLIAALLLMFLLTNIFPCGRRSFTSILAVINLMIITCVASIYATSVLMVTPEKDRKALKIAIGVVIIVCCSVMALHLLLNAIHLIADFVKEKQSRKNATDSAQRAENLRQQLANI